MKYLRYGIQVMTENIATDTKGILGMTADIFTALNPRGRTGKYSLFSTVQLETCQTIL